MPALARRPDPIEPHGHLGDLLHLLVQLGDGRFVEEIEAMVKYRVTWVLERNTPPPHP